MRLIGSFQTITTHGRSCSSSSPPRGCSTSTSAGASVDDTGSRESGDLQRFDLTVDREPLEGTRFDLAHALTREAELAADRLQRCRVAVTVEPVAALDDLALAVRQLRDCAPEHVLVEADRELRFRLRALARKEVSEPSFAVAPERLVEARDRPRRLPHLVDLLQRQLCLLGDLLFGRLPAELRRHLLLTLTDVDRNTDRARLVRDATLNGLADPPGGVGRELEASAPVELLDRADLLVVQLVLLDELVQVGEVDAPLILAPGDQRFDPIARNLGHPPSLIPDSHPLNRLPRGSTARSRAGCPGARCSSGAGPPAGSRRPRRRAATARSRDRSPAGRAAGRALAAPIGRRAAAPTSRPRAA